MSTPFFAGEAAKLAALDGDQALELIDGFVNPSDEIRERLRQLGWSESEVIGLKALIKTAAQHKLIDGSTWRGRIKAP